MRKIDRVEYENNQRKFESVYSTKVRAGKRRTYFFDVRKTKGDDFYITLTESTKRYDGDGYERHKIFLYKEDFNRFLSSLGDAINHVKTELMPDYDYDEFTRRQLEWEEKRAAMDLEAEKAEASAHASPKPDAPEFTAAVAELGENHEDTTTDEVPSAVESEETHVSENSMGESDEVTSEEETPAVISEDASTSTVSDKVDEVSTETDEEDMSW